MSDDIAIQVHNVSKSFKLPHEKHGSLKSLFVSGFRGKRSYEKQDVLKDISFNIKKGEFFGIVGRNGSGKSTLLKLMAGIYTPDKGNIQVNGKLTPFIELGVGFNPNLTGRENVFLNGALLGFSRDEMKAMYEEIVEFAELERFMDQKLKNYSSGMQVRLAFSIAVQVDSPILILDEVLAVGDGAFQRKCFDYFEEIKEQKKTVILVSHSMELIKRFCTAAIYIKDGKILQKGTPYEVADIYSLENIQASSQTGKDDIVKLSLENQKNNKLKIKIEYDTEEEGEKYIGLSFFKEGQMFSSISSDKDKTPPQKGELVFVFDKSSLNPGIYSVGAGLFKAKGNLRISGVGIKGRKEFVVKGDRDNKGSALKLEDTWQYEK